MARMYEPNTLVQLPPLDALAAQSVASAVLAAASDKPLPGFVAEAVAEVKVAVDALRAAAVERLPTNEPVARAVHTSLAGAWSALHGMLGSWSRLRDQERTRLAARLRQQLFPDGLRFTRLPFRLEWVASSIRLYTIDEHGYAPQIEELGGAVALAQIRQAHAQYGEVLSITAQTARPAIRLREPWIAVLNALRLFVVCVTASVRPRDPSSAVLARNLLAPIETWEPGEGG